MAARTASSPRRTAPRARSNPAAFAQAIKRIAAAPPAQQAEAGVVLLGKSALQGRQQQCLFGVRIRVGLFQLSGDYVDFALSLGQRHTIFEPAEMNQLLNRRGPRCCGRMGSHTSTSWINWKPAGVMPTTLQSSPSIATE